MQTEVFPHKVAAIYLNAERAESAMSALRDAGFDAPALLHLHSDSVDVQQAIEPEQAATRNHFIQDIVVGGGIGTVVGALSAGALAIAIPTIFISAPVVGPLMLAGYGTTLGATVGAIKAFKIREGLLSGMVSDAIKQGFHVVMVHSADAETQARAEAVINATMVAETASV